MSLAEYTGTPAWQAEDLIHSLESPCLVELRDAWIEAKEAVIHHRLLPVQPSDVVRVNHTCCIRIDVRITGRVRILRKILREGLAMQATGSGKYSELPTAVFGLVDLPSGDEAQRVYNPNYPWITADIPKRVLPRWDWDSRPGDVMVLPNIPREYFVGVNGLPAPSFMGAVNKWGWLPSKDYLAMLCKAGWSI